MVLKWQFVTVILVMELSSLTNGLTFSHTNNTRLKRQSQCSEFDFVCDDGNCIDDCFQCDGKYDCPDKSDETTACRLKACPWYAFKCAYGACVDGTVECNGIQDCVDNSDELTIKCPGVVEYLRERGNCSEGERQCRTGECVFEDQLCNGVKDCQDDSDENLARCFNFYCPPYGFKCDYGACVAGEAKCDGKYDCYDDSDETEQLCGKPPPPKATTLKPPPIDVPQPPGSCKAPLFADGRMVDLQSNEVFTGQFVLNYQPLKFSCIRSQLIGSETVYCVDGKFENIPKCSRHCSNVKINTISVEATCQSQNGVRFPCSVNGSSLLPPGTIADLKCKQGYELPEIYVDTRTVCEDDGSWSNRVFKCKQICGVIDVGYSYVSGGEETNITQVPWQAAIYEKANDRFGHICGGSIITATAVVSAAHCFWNRGLSKLKHEKEFQVVVGKTIRDYYGKDPYTTQTFNVTFIDVFEQYNDYNGLYTVDVAILELSSSIVYTPYIKPVCIVPSFEGAERYVDSDVKGRVAGWGLTENEKPSDILKVVDLDTVSFHKCKRRSPLEFKNFITHDKFCAGNLLNYTVCAGDSGGGFMITQEKKVGEKIQKVHYLQGIVSVGANSKKVCTPGHFIAFTNIQYVLQLIYKYLGTKENKKGA
uniref:Putative trypsin-like serine protease n=1 Tax=Nyssomyia neivai TaxID=330878 RepID=A0A1L8DQQ0_9DIPT